MIRPAAVDLRADCIPARLTADELAERRRRILEHIRAGRWGG